MKMWLLAGLITVATIPVAAAMDTTTDCQAEGSLRETREVQRERTDPPASPSPTTTTRTTVATRDPIVRPDQQQRRRSGKRVPDAELIGPRGAL
jgi:hypothetical protein